MPLDIEKGLKEGDEVLRAFAPKIDALARELLEALAPTGSEQRAQTDALVTPTLQYLVALGSLGYMTFKHLQMQGEVGKRVMERMLYMMHLQQVAIAAFEEELAEMPTDGRKH